MLRIGEKAPDFSLLDQNNQTIELKKLQGNTVVLYFYPKDNTPGCTREACDFRDSAAQFKNKKVAVLGISPDSVASHGKFAGKIKLPFPLLSDPDKNISMAYGVYKEKNMYGKKVMGIERTTFIIDPQGIIQKIFPKVKVEGHIVALLDAL
jgi:thioredoxin-dependent peroxiredoxin